MVGQVYPMRVLKPGAVTCKSRAVNSPEKALAKPTSPSTNQLLGRGFMLPFLAMLQRLPLQARATREELPDEQLGLSIPPGVYGKRFRFSEG